MKKIIMVLMALAMILPAANAQSNKKVVKMREKACKEKVKELKKSKWELMTSSKTLELALYDHYAKMNTIGDDAIEIVGYGEPAKTKPIAKDKAMSAARRTYAAQCGSTLKGRMAEDMASTGTDVSEDFSHFYEAFETLVEKEIKGEMQETMSIVRETKDAAGNKAYEVQVFYVISEDAASKARIRAFENAAKESAAAQKYADKISDWVREGFEK